MMTPDPYAAPRAPLEPPPTFTAGGPGPWNIGDTLSASWKAFTHGWLPLVFAPLLVGFVLAIPMIVIVGVFIAPSLGNAMQLAAALQDPTLNAAMLGWNVVSLPIYAFVQPGIVKMRLAAVRNEPVLFGDLFSGGSVFGSMLVVQLLLAGPGIFVGALGIIGRFGDVRALVAISNLLSNLVLLGLLIFQALGLVFAEYLVVDRKQGAIEAIKGSLALPSGDRGSVFGYFLVVALIAMGGLMCCAFPGLVTMPYAGVCVAMLFTKIAPAK